MGSLALKRALVAGGAAVVLGIGAIGVAAAQQSTQPTPTPPGAQRTPGAQVARGQQFLDALAKRLGVSTDALKQAIHDARKDSGLPDRGGFPLGPRPGGPGRPGPRGGLPPIGPLVGDAAKVAATTIGITPAQLRQELPGRSLADVARAHSVDPAKVADAIKADITTHIDQAVANGRLNADRAAQMKQRLSDQVDAQMDRQVPTRPAGTRAPGGPGPRPGATPRPATTSASFRQA